MKTLKYILGLFVISAILVSCKNENSPEIKTVDLADEEVKEKVLNPDANYVAAKFEIDGMMCAMGCAKVIEKNIAQMDGVKTVEVDFESKMAKVEFDEDIVTRDLVIANVKKTGDTYEVTSWNGEVLNAPEEIIEE
ncbi:MAG: cation transporter [Flavobacteriaceae bacterium]|nr:cation transporter [Flavobacteriaceae bacterium]